jgi:nucleobindin
VPPPEKQEPSIKFKEAEKEAKSAEEWGSGDAGYKVPREASERMRFVFFSSN